MKKPIPDFEFQKCVKQIMKLEFIYGILLVRCMCVYLQVNW